MFSEAESLAAGLHVPDDDSVDLVHRILGIAGADCREKTLRVRTERWEVGGLAWCGDCAPILTCRRVEYPNVRLSVREFTPGNRQEAAVGAESQARVLPRPRFGRYQD